MYIHQNKKFHSNPVHIPTTTHAKMNTAILGSVTKANIRRPIALGFSSSATYKYNKFVFVPTDTRLIFSKTMTDIDGIHFALPPTSNKQ